MEATQAIKQINYEEMNVLTLDIDDIIIDERKRPYIEAKASMLADTIKIMGLLQPIVVKPDFTLLAGRHRLGAYKLLGQTKIPAVIKDYDAVDSELAEIDENLSRSELTSLERNIQYARRKELWQQKYPESLSTRERNKLIDAGKKTFDDFKDVPHSKESKVADFITDTSKKTGRSISSVRNDTLLGEALMEKLTPEIRSLISPTKVANNKVQLEKLLDEPDPDVRLEIAQELNREFNENGSDAAYNVTDISNRLKKTTTYESVVGGDTGEGTLLNALKRNKKLINAAVNNPKFQDTIDTWTLEGIEDIREEFFDIQKILEKGINALTETFERKAKLG